MTGKLHAPGLFALALYALLLLAVLMMAGLGGSLYASLTVGRAANEAARASLHYVAEKLAAADEAGAVTIRSGPEGDLLELGEPADRTGYSTKIYLSGGRLLEEYTPVSAAPDPATATTVADTSRFSVTQSGPLFTVTTGEGTLSICLHSEEGTA